MCTKLYIFFIQIYFFILIQIGDFRQNKSLPHFSIQNTHLYIFCIHLYMFCRHLYIFCILFFNGLDIPLVKVYIAYVMHLKPGVYLETRICCFFIVQLESTGICYKIGSASFKNVLGYCFFKTPACGIYVSVQYITT